jgi:hypothetical protein
MPAERPCRNTANQPSVKRYVNRSLIGLVAAFVIAAAAPGGASELVSFPESSV